MYKESNTLIFLGLGLILTWRYIYMKVKELQEKFENDKKLQKEKIRQEPNKWKRFWKWVWYLITFPFKWIWVNIRDWRTMIIFMIVVIVVSIEVWLPYLLGAITWGSDFSKWCLGIGSACFIWWQLPGTPFIMICVFLTMAIKGLFDKIRSKRLK